MVIRTGDPFGLFESSATVGSGATLIVYPAVEALPRWRLPPAMIEGSNANPERTHPDDAAGHEHPAAMRPATPTTASTGRARRASRSSRSRSSSSSRPPTSGCSSTSTDACIPASVDNATIETAVRACASISARALLENRAVGLAAVGARRAVLPVDRGARQHQKVMQLMAAVQADGTTPLARAARGGHLPRLRRGMTAIVITPSLDRDWVRPLTSLRTRGVACTVVIADPLAHLERSLEAAGERPLAANAREEYARGLRAVRHALAEYELRSHVVVPRTPLGDQIVTVGPRVAAGAR